MTAITCLNLVLLVQYLCKWHDKELHDARNAYFMPILDFVDSFIVLKDVRAAV